MRTSKPYSTISYNTESFLQKKLNNLIRDGVLDFWVYIKHLPEVDEKRSHIHLFVIPAKLVNTSSFLQHFVEADISSPDKPPLRCLPCQSSKFGDWYLYSRHDKDYLASKMQARKYSYRDCDFICSDGDYFNELIRSTDFSAQQRFGRFRDLVLNGAKFYDLVAQGFIPVPLINQYAKVYEALLAVSCNRNGGCTHTPTDGEVVPDFTLTDDYCVFK